MTICAPIVGLKLDATSLAAVERLQEKVKLGQALAALITAGTFNSIFTKSKPPVVGYNITQTDWGLYAEAMSAIPVITKKRLEQEIDLMLLHYYMLVSCPVDSHDFSEYYKASGKARLAGNG